MIEDKHFRIDVIRRMPNPQQVIWAAMHQDYAEDMAIEDIPKGNCPKTEKEAGDLVIKHLLKGGRGHYGCYFEDTEVLTESGFTPWASVLAAEKNKMPFKLASIDLSTGYAHFEQPSALFEYEITNESLYELKGRYIDQLVTSDHRMPVSSRTKNGWSEWRFDRASEVEGKPVRYRLNGHYMDGKEKDIPDKYLQVAGFYFGDGETITADHPSCVRFRLKKKRKIEWLKSLGFSVDEQKNDRYVIHDAELAWFLRWRWSGDGGRKCIPLEVIQYNHRQFDLLMQGLRASDGTRFKESSFSYDSANLDALDTLQASASVHGIHANITLNNPSQNKKHKDCWRIHFNYDRHFCRVETNQKGRTESTTEKWIKKTGKIYCATVSTGALIVRRNRVVSVSGNCLEHPQIVLNAGYFPHSTMQQLRTHRLLSFDVQSFRYTGQRIVDVTTGKRDVEEVFYLRPTGNYSDRKGHHYSYTSAEREEDKRWCVAASERYAKRMKLGHSEEHARSFIPFDIRQHFVISMNVRSLMHLLDLRWKKDAQLEAQAFCDHLWPHFSQWCPQIAGWYTENRAHKARLAP